MQETTPDLIEKGKKTRRRIRDLERLHEDSRHPAGSGAHAAAEGYCEAMKPDMDKGAAQMATSAQQDAARGNPADVPDFNAQRAADNTGRRVAVGAPDLNQQPARDFSGVLANLRANPYNFVGAAAFNSAFGSTDRPAEAQGDNVTVRGYDAAAEAGRYSGMMPVDTAPRQPVREYHQHRDSAVSPNGTHSLTNVESHAVSNKSRRDIMKEALFGHD